MTLPSNIINTATFRHFGNVIIANNPTILSPNIGLQYVQTKVAIATISKRGDMLLSKRLPVKKNSCVTSAFEKSASWQITGVTVRVFCYVTRTC